MVAESCVKIETRKDNRTKIYFIKIDNCKDDILCGRMFTVENGHTNKFLKVVKVKSKVN